MSAPIGDTGESSNRKRRSNRARRRLTCSFSIGGQLYRGITIDLSVDGLFIQTDTTAPPGSEVGIDLIGSGRTPDVHVHGVIARRRAVPAMLASAIRRGIGVRLLDAPREYGLLFQDRLLDTAIQRSGRRPLRAPDRAVELPEPILATVPSTESPDPTAGAEPDPGPARESSRSALGATDLARPDVLLMDDGSLGEVAAILEQIGAEGLWICTRRGSSPNVWVRPRRLLVTSASLALSFPWPERRGEDGFAGIAITDDDSQTLSTRIGRLGFRHLVRRTIHPEALRFLLRQALHDGRERRSVPRFGLDCAVRCGGSLRHRAGSLVDLSSRGCRLTLPAGPLTLRWFVKLSLRPDPMGRSGPNLHGRIIRREAVALPSGEPGLAIAVVFERPSSRTRKRLDALLAHCAAGHVHPPRTQLVLAPFVHAARPVLEASKVPTEVGEEAGEEAGQPPLEGSALSITRMCASSLPAGRRFDLELYEGPLSQPLRIGAEVCPDDDREGFDLRFVDREDECELAQG